MMKLTVREVAEVKGYKNARQLADMLSMSYSSIYPIWQGTAKRVDLDTLDKLCTLLDVPVAMLIQHIPDRDIEARGSHGTQAQKPAKIRGPKRQIRGSQAQKAATLAATV